jgi:hypothetical protein
MKNNTQKINSLIACFRTAVNMRRNGADEILDSGIDLYRIRENLADDEPIHFILEEETELLLRDNLLEIAGLAFDNTRIARCIVDVAVEGEKKLYQGLKSRVKFDYC